MYFFQNEQYCFNVTDRALSLPLHLNLIIVLRCDDNMFQINMNFENDIFFVDTRARLSTYVYTEREKLSNNLTKQYYYR